MLTIVSIYLRLIMSDVQINANAVELESFIQVHDNNPFPAMGMVSSVRRCQDLSYFTKYHKFCTYTGGKTRRLSPIA